MEKKKKGNRKLGRSKRKPTKQTYVSHGRRLKNKIKKVLKSSGVEEARRYAKKYGGTGHVERLIKQKGLEDETK